MRAILVVGALLSSQAVADPCKTDRAWLQKITPELQQLGDHADDAALTCGLRGADPKLLGTLVAEAKRVIKDLRAMPDGKCKLNAAGLTTKDFVNHLADWTTEQLVPGVVMCSTKIRTVAIELKKTGKTESDIDAELHKLATTFMSEATK
jgi:hypothetical protein